MYHIDIKKSAEKEIASLEKSHRNRIIAAILNLETNPRTLKTKKLVGTENRYRLEVGDYRVLYEIDDENKQVVIYRVRHRREVYR
ncbi:MAG: type II toxin-antitoxin system RelE/ParE family toxin [Candidatus Omnitrophica bacterium]|nr:type II toxin-antitoxin system RelE/ParE family toxin [Candidatus Omnitrophota bacterium]